MRIRKYCKYLIIFVGIVFIILNIWIAIQAYSMTHFSENSTPDNLKFNYSTLLTGISISKPKSDIIPNRKFQTVKIPVGKNKSLESWVLNPSSQSKGMILLFHGFRAEKSTMLDRAYEFLDMGYKVMLVDFSGAGNSYGTQCTVGYLEAENVKQAYEYAVNNLKEDKISFCGFSMGAAAIIKAQHDYNLKVDNLILEAPYGKMIDAVKIRLKIIPFVGNSVSYLITFWGGVVNGFNAFKMNPDEYIKNIHVPVLILYGGKDPRIPGEESQRIFENCGSDKKQIKLFPESYHHSYLDKYPTEWRKAITSFLSKNRHNR